VYESLAPDIKKKIKDLYGYSFNSEVEANQNILDGLTSFESRVASYANAFWTIEEKAVKEIGSAYDVEVNFIGVQDNDNCPGCADAINGNPYKIDEAPQPGDQDCLGNCRHALQIVGDEALTESDINILRESEALAKSGKLFQ